VESRSALFYITFHTVPHPGSGVLPIEIGVITAQACVLGFVGGLLGDWHPFSPLAFSPLIGFVVAPAQCYFAPERVPIVNVTLSGVTRRSSPDGTVETGSSRQFG
jgi:hypothetical protein